jgi:ubiquinone/menaquinone biosynthesis C-methylase UbiE
MSRMEDDLAPPPEVVEYYARFAEESRLESGSSKLEFERTKVILARVLPAPPATIVDVGGAAGTYSFWLAAEGHDVHLIDASARLVDEARRRNQRAAAPIASLSVGDARRLSRADACADAVLLMGPLYHLPDEGDRLATLREAYRVLVPGGVVAVAAISRYASALDGLARKLSLDPRFVAIRNRDLLDGQHRNETGNATYFTTAYFHRPDDLARELAAAQFRDVEVLGVEGPGWILPDLDSRWADAMLRQDILDVAWALEREAAIIGASAHLLGIGRKHG